MLVHTLKKAVFLAAMFTLALTAAVYAVDAYDSARAASDRIDSDLQRTAADLTRELGDAENQIQEAHRLGTADSVANRYGDPAEIDRRIGASSNEANRELRRAAARDDYNLQRQILVNNRSLYYPDSEGYNNYTRQIEEFDRRFSERMETMDLNSDIGTINTMAPANNSSATYSSDNRMNRNSSAVGASSSSSRSSTSTPSFDSNTRSGVNNSSTMNSSNRTSTGTSSFDSSNRLNTNSSFNNNSSTTTNTNTDSRMNTGSTSSSTYGSPLLKSAVQNQSAVNSGVLNTGSVPSRLMQENNTNTWD